MPDEEGLLVIKFKPVKDFGKMKAGYDKKVNEHNAESVDCATLSTIL